MRFAFLLALAACGAGISGYDSSKYRGDSRPPDTVDPEIAPIERGAKRWMLDPRRPLDAGAD